MNHLIVTGRLTRDPELKSLPSGDTVCNMRMAVDRMAPKGETGYIDITQYGAGGEAAARILHKGSPAIFDGRLEYRTWTADDGTNRHEYQGVGSVEFMARDTPAEQPQAAEAA
jgi:single-strand DNA-binding protein